MRILKCVGRKVWDIVYDFVKDPGGDKTPKFGA